MTGYVKVLGSQAITSSAKWAISNVFFSRNLGTARECVHSTGHSIVFLPQLVYGYHTSKQCRDSRNNTSINAYWALRTVSVFVNYELVAVVLVVLLVVERLTLSSALLVT